MDVTIETEAGEVTVTDPVEVVSVDWTPDRTDVLVLWKEMDGALDALASSDDVDSYKNATIVEVSRD